MPEDTLVAVADVEAPAPVTYAIKAPDLAWWNKDEGRSIPVPPYNSVARAERPIVAGVRIIDGKGETTDAVAALELADMGFIVTPDPHVAVQDLKLAELKERAEFEPDPALKVQYNTLHVRFARVVAAWRRAHGIPV
jgi:hypothetical protein